MANGEPETGMDGLSEMLADLAKLSRALEEAIEELEEVLAAAGDDALLANLDLRNEFGRIQETMRAMTKVSKLLHEQAMAIIRKIG